MGLKGKIDKLQRAMRGRLAYFELADGRIHYFDPEEVPRHTFMYFANSLTADGKREPRPEPPEILRAVADARDRAEALALVMGGYGHLPVDREALVERGEFVPRSLVAGKSYEDLGIRG